jgi:hypothetical protein
MDEAMESRQQDPCEATGRLVQQLLEGCDGELIALPARPDMSA